MKPRLPHRLIQALLTVSAAALATTSPAFADVPEGYTSVTITDASQLADYAASDYTAFVIQNNLKDTTYRVYADHQFWTSETADTSWSINYSGILNSADNGGVLKASSSLTLERFSGITFNKNHTSSHFDHSTSTSTTIHSSYYSFGGAIYGGFSSTINITDNGDVTFSDNFATKSSHNTSSYVMIYDYCRGGAVYGDETALINLSKNKSITFTGNYASDSYRYESQGGAIYGGLSSNILLSDNGSVRFSGNRATNFGGAIYGEESSSIQLSGNESIEFNENNVQGNGGAIYGGDSTTINLTNNVIATFSQNTAGNGGAICAITSSIINLSSNRNLTFSDNSASESYGGAIFASKTQSLNITSNGTVLLCGNTAAVGGAIYVSSNSKGVNLNSNKSITFSGNASTDGYGGAITSFDDVNITYNTEVTFDSNSSSSKSASSAGYCSGGAIYASPSISISDNESVLFCNNTSLNSGGAICSSSIKISGNALVSFLNNSSSAGSALSGSVILSNNDNVSFVDNASTSRGAVSSGQSIIFSGNDHIDFSGNYEKSGSGDSVTYRLRGVYMDGNSLNLAAGQSQDIIFYDPLYARAKNGTVQVSLNSDYVDKDNVQQKATGDIVFSGARATEDLGKLKSNFTQQELTNSLTSEVYATTNLYGGRLRIEDGAIYKGNGINVAANSAATLRLDNGTLNQTGYNVEMHAGTTLDLEGENSITASTLKMMDGSTLSFNLGSQEGALLSLNGILNTGKITIALSGDMQNAHELINLADVSQYDTSMWTEQRIAVSGTNFKHLVWNNGILSYTGIIESHIELDNDKEITDFDGGDIVDVEGNKHKLTVKHPVDLVHLAMKDGVVKLEGADNNVVRITLTEDGTLQLAAGAGLNVGNIVSMVANGSADLEISGDIEISDIKAYGKPGNKGTLSYVNMTTAGDYTIENMTITGSVIDVGEGTTLYLVNVDIKSDTHITDDPAWVYAQNANIQLDKNNTWVDKEITAAQDMLLYMCGDTQRSITLAVGSEIVELTSSMFDSVTLTGTDLWLDMTGIAEATYNKDFFTLDFQDLAREMAKAQVDVENLHVYATLDGETYTEAYSTANGGLTTTLYFQVPEPATTTLSLLALAALAARRRRK